MKKILGPIMLGLTLTTMAMSPDFALADASENGCLHSGGQAAGCTNGTTYSTNSVPVSGSTLVLFGAGFVALALWHHRRRGNSAV